MSINSIPINNLPLEKCDWFSLLSVQEQNNVLHSSSTVIYKQKETIIKQGFAASHILFLESGIVKLNVQSRGRVTTFKIIEGGSFIGLMCSFVCKTLDFSAISISDCKVIVLDRDVFESLIANNGAFAVYVVKLISETTNGIVHNLINLSHKNVNGALATFLLDIYDLFKKSRFILPFNRTEIAHSLGYSKESIINALSDFQRDGIIIISGKNITINDIESLIKISKNG